MTHRTQAEVVRALIGDLSEQLQVLVAADGSSQAANTAKLQLAEIVDMAEQAPDMKRAADHVADAVDRVCRLQRQAARVDDEQSSRAINLLEDPLSELKAAAHRLP